MKCHTCHHRRRILDVGWLHPYLSYDWGSEPNKIPPSALDQGEKSSLKFSYGNKKTRCGNNGFKLKKLIFLMNRYLIEIPIGLNNIIIRCTILHRFFDFSFGWSGYVRYFTFVGIVF
jgi:hypothetical protein